MDYYRYNDMMGGWGNNGYAGDSIGFWIILPLLAALTFIIILVTVRYSSRTSHMGSFRNSASEVLKRRYAQGEIDKKQYDEMKKDIAE